MRYSTLVDVLRATIGDRLPILLLGAPGVGKTAAAAEAAGSLGMDLVVSTPVTSEPVDYRGLPWVVDGTAHFLPVGDLERLAQTTRPTVWLIDDLGQAPTTVQAAIMQLVHKDGRSLGGLKLPDHVSVIACTNRSKDRAGVRQFLAPLLSRFVTAVELSPDVTDWIRWALGAGLDPLVCAFLRWRPEHLLDETPASSLEPRCSPRTWESVARILALRLPAEVTNAMIAGAITPAVALELSAFLLVYKTLPNVDAIRADPTGAALPDRLDVAYATVVHLAVATSAGDFPVLAQYVGRLAPELQWLYMLSLLRREPSLASTPTYIAWSTSPAAQIG